MEQRVVVRLATMTTSPPRPPSPPLGPPRGTNFSRRKARQPFPPSPAFTEMMTSSMNRSMCKKEKGRLCSRAGSWLEKLFEARFCGKDVHVLAQPAAIAKLDDAGNLANNVSSLPQPTFLPGL